jgi:hypothetical protein
MPSFQDKTIQINKPQIMKNHYLLKLVMSVMLIVTFIQTGIAQTVTVNTKTPGALATYTFTYVTTGDIGTGTVTPNIFLFDGISGYPDFLAVTPLISFAPYVVLKINNVVTPIDANSFGSNYGSWTTGIQISTGGAAIGTTIAAGSTIELIVSGIITNPAASGNYTFNWRTADDGGNTTESYSANVTIVSPTLAAQWQGYNSANQSFPMDGTKAPIISSASLNYGNGLLTYDDGRTVWNSNNTSATVDPLTAPYCSYSITTGLSRIIFDRFVLTGLANAGSTKEQLRWSVDNFSTSLGDFTSDGSNYTLTSVDLSGQSAVPGGTIEFRVYAYGGSGPFYNSSTGPYASLDGTSSYYNVWNTTASIWYIAEIDITPPTVITQNISVQLDASGNATITPGQIDNGSSDSNGIANMSLNKTSFSCGDIGDNTVSLTVTDTSGNSASANATVTITASVVSPAAVFGTNEWKVYTYINTPNACIPNTNYEGYYTEPGLSFDTKSRWNVDDSPSYASGYIGNPVPTDNHSFVAKRKGFSVGYYSIDIPSHDDDAFLLINGIEVWNHVGCCDSHSNVWQGILNADSTVEYRIIEYGGGSYGAITFNLVPLAINTVVGNFPSSSCETTVTVTASGGTPPYTGDGVFTVSPGTHNYSVFDSLGAEATTSVIVKDDNSPVVAIKNISVTLDVNGQAVVTPAMIDNNSSDNCGITSYQIATGTPVSPKIYFTGTDRFIWSANRDGTGSPTPLYDYHDNNMQTVVGIEANLDNSNLYFAAPYRNVYNASLDGLGTINTIPNTSSSGNLLDLEIDQEGNRLFYTDSNNGIFSTTIDGSASPTQIVAGTQVVSLTFDKTHQKIYYVNPNGAIGVVDANGSNANNTLFLATTPRGITINEATGRLFWIEKDSKEIYTALVDGSETPHVLYSFAVGDNFVQNAYGIDFDPNTNTLFWTAFGYSNDDTLYTAPADGSGVPKILYKGNFGSIRGIAAGRNIHGVSLNSSTNDITYSVADIGSQTLYLIVTDAAGNKSVSPATITVLALGNSGPAINCSSNLSQNVDAGLCTASVITQDLQITNIGDVSSLTWAMTGATVGASIASGINYVGTTIFNSGVTTITYTAKDVLNNVSTCSFTVTVIDNVLPVAITKNITVSLDTNGQATLLPSQINDGSTDNCQIASYKLLTGTSLSPKIYFTGTNNVIWSANRDGTGSPTPLYDYHDNNMTNAVGIEANLNNGNLYFGGAGNNNIYNATLDGVGTINTIPNTSPSCNQHDLEIDWDANKLFYTDSCNGVYVTSIDGTEPQTQIGTNGAVALTYDKTNQKIYYVNPYGSIGVVNADGSNENSNLFSANSPRGITINEATGRLFWVEKDSKEIYTALVDGLEAPHVLYSFAVGNNFVNNGYGIDFDPNTNTLFWTAFGNNFEDTVYTAPADGSGVPQVLFVSNYGSIRGIAAGRNIHGKSLTQYANSIAYTTSDIGDHTETLVVTDANGNKASAVATVTVIAAPFSITCPGNIAKSADSGVCAASVVVANPILSNLGSLSTLTWNTTGATIGNSSVTGINYIGTAIFNSGVTTITYTATDNSATVVECTFTVTVTDTESPIVLTKNITIALDSNGQAILIPSQIDNVSTDNCGIASYQLTKATALSPFIYFSGVTDGKIWKANRDGSGVPVLLISSSPGAAGIEVNYDNGKLYYATSTTNKIYEEPLSGLGVSSIVPNTDQGNNKHDFEYDWAGNRIFYTANNGGIYVASIDGLSAPIQLVNNAQVVTLTFDKTNQKIYYGNLTGSIGVVNADGTGENNTLFTATSPKGITINEATGRVFWVEQSLKKIYTALIDGSEAPHQLYSTGATGNPFGIDYDATTDSLYWTVFNSGEKIVTAPASGVGTPLTLFNGSYGGLRGIAAGRNIKGNDLSSAASSLAYDCSNVGNNTAYLIVKDAAGNTSFSSATVAITDTTLPTIATENPINVNADAGVCTYTSSQLTAPTAADNCSVASVLASPASLVSGANAVTWTVTDASGLTANSSQSVTVIDSQNPTIATEDSINVNADAGVCTYASSQLTAPTTADNCSVVSVLASPASLALGANTVTWTVTDASGLTANSSQSVTVIDSQNPTIATEDPINVNADAGVCTYASSQLTAPTTADNCSVVSVLASPASLVSGANTVTWTVTDVSGLTATSTQSVTVIDSQNPTIATLSAINVNADAGVCTYASSQLTAPTAADNCSVVSVIASPVSLASGANTVTWTVTDASGLTATSTQSVTVVDSTAPTVITKNIIVPLDASGNATLTAAEIDNGSSDNCGINTMTLSQYAFTISDIGIKSITLTVTDNSGNTSSATAQVTIDGTLNTDVPIAPKNNAFVIYPIPFDNYINITLPDSYTEDVIYIQVYDLTGKAVYNKKQVVDNHNVTINDLNEYSDGSYYINLLDGNQNLIQSKHIIKKAKQ